MIVDRGRNPAITPSNIADCAELDPHLVRLIIPDADARLKSKQRISPSLS